MLIADTPRSTLAIVLVAVLTAGSTRDDQSDRGTAILAKDSSRTPSAYSPDKQRILTAVLTDAPRVWNAKTGRLELVLTGHTDQVTTGVWSPDGKRIATGSADRTAKIWDAASGRLMLDLRGFPGSVDALVFSPDATLVAGSHMRELRIFDARTGNLRYRVPGVDAVFSPDSRMVITVGYESPAELRDAATGKVIRTLGRRGWYMSEAVWSRDGARIAIADQDGGQIWDVARGRVVAEFGAGDGIFGLEYDRAGTRILTWGSAGVVRVWDATTGELLQDLVGHEGLVRVGRFSPDGTLIASGGHDDGVAMVWDASTGEVVGEMLGHRGHVVHLEWSPDSTKIVTGSTDTTAIVWDARTSRDLLTIQHGWFVFGVEFSPDSTRALSTSTGLTQVHDVAARQLAFDFPDHAGVLQATASPDGKHLAVFGLDETATVYDLATGGAVFALEHRGRVNGLAFSPDGTQLATSSTDSLARLWDASTGRLQHTLDYFRCDVTSVAYSDDGRRLLTNGGRYGPCIWEPQTGRHIYDYLTQTTSFLASQSPDGNRVVTSETVGPTRLWQTKHPWDSVSLSHIREVDRVAFSADSTRLVTASRDHMAKLWNGKTGRNLARLAGHTGWVTDATFSPDGTWIATASRDGTARIWSASSGAPLRVLAGHELGVERVVFDAGGTRLLTWGWDARVRVWDPATGRLRFALEHAATISAAVFNPRRDQIITASADGRARAWSASTGRLQFTLGHAARIHAVITTPDGRRIITTSHDGTVKIWDADSGELGSELRG
jgi:WD40 repeat protein